MRRQKGSFRPLTLDHNFLHNHYKRTTIIGSVAVFKIAFFFNAIEKKNVHNHSEREDGKKLREAKFVKLIVDLFGFILSPKMSMYEKNLKQNTGFMLYGVFYNCNDGRGEKRRKKLYK